MPYQTHPVLCHKTRLKSFVAQNWVVAAVVVGLVVLAETTMVTKTTKVKVNWLVLVVLVVLVALVSMMTNNEPLGILSECVPIVLLIY